jgi:hypothetical protein
MPQIQGVVFLSAGLPEFERAYESLIGLMQMEREGERMERRK